MVCRTSLAHIRIGSISRLLMVGSQIGNLTPSLSFDLNLCRRCPNGSCKAVLDMYISKPFQRYKEHPNARCFDPCNWTLKFWESQRTPKSHFRECEWQHHTSLKVGRDIKCKRKMGKGKNVKRKKRKEKKRGERRSTYQRLWKLDL